jgi:hypothetical protein
VLPPLLELLDVELLLEELLDEEEDELLELLDDDELDPPAPVIVPVEAVRVTRSSFEPSSRLRILRVCAPAPRLLKVAGVSVPQPVVAVLFWVVQAPESSL